MNSKMNRRKFIGNSAVAAAAITLIPRHVLGGNGFIAANDRINVGYIGVGKQVYTLLNGIGKCKETVAVAACD
ncbi:MAG: twin-arginine translocation signal domain-containing protein, partial [Bacteroidota bacterium]|nr:twin-arginine translocation signal domain-containing protein [Bacteroidota bacterium]